MKYTFKNKKGLLLSGRLELPKIKNSPVVIFAHGLNSGKDSSRNTGIAKELVKNNIAAFLIDFTGHGESEGGPPETVGIEDMVEDLKAAVNFVKKQKIFRIGINGSSSGGTVAIIFCSTSTSIKALVVRAPPSAEVLAYAKKIKIPTRIIQGKGGPLLQENKDLFEKLTCKKDLAIIKNGHLFQDPKSQKEMIKKTVEWFKENL